MQDFVHLHLHTEYSLLDGAIKLDELFQEAKRLKFNALAITDHGNMFGVIKFYKKAKEYLIKPIIGMEVYIAAGSRLDKPHNKEILSHAILLAKNNKGYNNLVHLASFSYTEGFYYKPRIDMELLRKYSEGLILLSGCLKSKIAYYILNQQIDLAKKLILQFKDIFNNDFYIELLDHGLEEEKKLNKILLELANLYSIGVVATNDVHYLKKSHATAHDILLCIQTNKTYHEKNRLRFPNAEFYLKSKEEMYELFRELPKSIENTVNIADTCEVEIELGKLHLPVYGGDSQVVLRELCQEGIQKRFGVVDEEVQGRLEYELSIINNMGLCDYFLIVYEITSYAKRNSIPVGPGRGSAAGSLVAYSLGITDINPLEWGLLFERFLNPQRLTLPDIDIDFADEQRTQVLNYIRERFGENKVANIITFGTLQARGVIRDVGRALGLPYNEVDNLAKHINASSSLSDLEIEKDPSLERLIDNKEKWKLVKIAKVLEGQVRHVSIHAAGIVISDKPLINILPLYKDAKEGIIATQYDKDAIEDIGLLKMDILGLKTLSVIDNTLKLIKSRYYKEILPEDIDLNDKKVYRLLSEGETVGVFQLESRGMQNLLTRICPTTFRDLIAVLALHRPGPLQSGMVDEFIKAKTTQKIPNIHPLLEDILEETYGVIIYQEQVMKIAEKLAGFSLVQADKLRRAMSKKSKKEMQELEAEFIKSAIEKDRGLLKEEAKEIFSLLEKFSEYGFNKSHASAYARVAYRTAYLKAHYPTEYFCCLLTSEMSNSNEEKLNFYIKECDRRKILVLPPNINTSYYSFTVEDDNKIRFGLGGIKHIGFSVVNHIVEERKQRGRYNSLFNFCRRVDSRVVNRKSIETLIKCGVFDSLGGNRAQMLVVLENIQEIMAKSKNRNFGTSGQMSLFNQDDLLPQEEQLISSVDLPELPGDVLESYEIELLGAYLSPREKQYKDLYITLSPGEVYEEDLYELKALLKNYPGYSNVYIRIKNSTNKEILIKLSDKFRINIEDKEFLNRLNILLKEAQIEVV